MKKNNKGSAFVMVLVILAIVGILAAVALWVSLVNYQMKITDVKVKNNFYSAESVLDQVCVGLQSDVSVAYERAYKTVSVLFSDMTDAERKTEFEKIYKKELKRRLKATDDATDMSYKIDKLRGYVYQDIQDATKLPYAQLKVVDRADCLANNHTDGKMITYDNHIVLKGIEVTFTDEDGYTSIIETDISLNIPDMDFLTVNSTPNTLSYSLVGNTGVTIAGDTTINGSLYAGNSGNIKRDVSLDINGAVTFEKSKYVISYGRTQINIAQGLKVDTDTQFWTQNIEVNGGQNVKLGANAILLGNTFVADDLTLDGNSPKVILGAGEGADHFEGQYIGFGNSKENAEESSAIILNGTNSTLDISRLKNLKLSGYAFVNTNQIPADAQASGTSEANVDVKTGESIAVKSGQIAYLIPPECIGVDQSSGKSMFNKNPLTYAEEKKIKETSGCKEVDGTTFSKQIGSSLDAYLGDDKTKDIMSIVSKVHVSKDGGLTYYYIKLDQEQAARYFRNYQGGSKKERFDLYTDFYTDKIQILDDSSAVQTVGNCVSYDGETPTISAPKATGLSNEMVKYSANYGALKYILYPNSELLTSEILNKGNVFSNLIDETKLSEVLHTSGKVVVTYTDADSSDQLKAILVNGNYEYKGSDDPKGEVALIIATGNVKVDSNFKGSIIAKGKIQIGMTAAMISGRTIDELRKLLKQEISSGNPLYAVFNDGESYLTGTVTDEKDSTTKQNDKIPYSDIITYQNWKKK